MTTAPLVAMIVISLHGIVFGIYSILTR